MTNSKLKLHKVSRCGFFHLTREWRDLTLHWLKTCMWSRNTNQVTHTPENQGNHLPSSAPRWGGPPPKDGSGERAHTGLLSSSPYSASAAPACLLLSHVEISQQSHWQQGHNPEIQAVVKLPTLLLTCLQATCLLCILDTDERGVPEGVKRILWPVILPRMRNFYFSSITNCLLMELSLFAVKMRKPVQRKKDKPKKL